jgi:hypothetical protein
MKALFKSKLLKEVLVTACIMCLMLPTVALASSEITYRSKIYPEESYTLTDQYLFELKLAKLLYEKAPSRPGDVRDIEIAVNLPLSAMDVPQISVDIKGSQTWTSSKFINYDYIDAIGTPKGTLLIFRNVRVDDTMHLDDPENEEVVRKLIDGAKKYSSIEGKLGYINDEIALHTKYSYDHNVPDGEDVDFIGLVLREHKGVCTHFAMTLKYILDRLGVPSVIGASTRSNHMMNFVYVDGKWKAWDLTWNICNGTADDVIIDWYKGPDGKPVIVKGPGIRSFFLMDPDGHLFKNEYVPEFGKWFTDFLLTAEAQTAIEYPELPTAIKIDPSDILANINEVKDYIAKYGGKKQFVNEPDSNTVAPVLPPNDHTKVPDPVGDTSAGQIDPSMVSGGSFSISTDSSGKLVVTNNSNTTTQVNQQKAKAQPTSSSVIINGKKVAFEAYNIGGYNYFKLRDIAMALNGTDKQFEVKFDGSKNAILITTGSKYTAVGGELKVSGAKSEKPAVPTPSKVYINGKEVQFTAYNIDGYNYFKLRDIGKALNLGVFWDGTNNTIRIDTTKVYTE